MSKNLFLHDNLVHVCVSYLIKTNLEYLFRLSSVQSLSRVQLFETPWTTACKSSLSITNSRNLLKLISIELVMPSNHLIPCRPLLLLPSIFPSTRVFSNESVLHNKWPKCFKEFQLQHQSFQWIFRTDSFRMDWLDLLAAQGTLKSLLEHHCSKASIFQRWAFFIVQLSHAYMTTGKTIAGSFVKPPSSPLSPNDT